MYQKQSGQQDRAVTPVLSTGEAELEHSVQFWTLHYKKDMKVLEWIQERTMKMGKGLEHTSDE